MEVDKKRIKKLKEELKKALKIMNEQNNENIEKNFRFLYSFDEANDWGDNLEFDFKIVSIRDYLYEDKKNVIKGINSSIKDFVDKFKKVFENVDYNIWLNNSGLFVEISVDFKYDYDDEGEY